MKRNNEAWVWRIGLLVSLALFLGSGSQALAGGIKLEAQLIWGTNDDKSPNPEHKPVGPNVEAKLKKLPIKWKNYFLVNRKEFKVAKGKTTSIEMSEDCELKVSSVDGTTVEIELVGKGKVVGKITKDLSKGKCLVMGGDAENYTSWFVFIREIK